MPGAPIVLLTGAPGSGKTTCARLLAERFDLSAHVEADDFFHAITTGYIEPWRPESHDQNRMVIHAVARAARTYAGAGYTTVVEGIVGPWFLDDFRAQLDPEVDLRFIVLRVPIETAIERARSRPRSPLDEGPVRKMYEQLLDLGELERHVVDASNTDPSDLAARLYERLTTGELRLL